MANSQERRSHRRVPLALAVRVSANPREVLECEVKDFCLGGMYLVHREAPVDGDAGAVMIVDDTVELEFDLEPGGASRRHAVKARVAGLWGDGIGVEFIAPEPTALQALQDLAQRQRHASDRARSIGSGADPAATASVAEAAKSAEILDACRKQISRFLETESKTIFKHACDSLFISARDSRNNIEQNEYFDLIKEVERLQPPVEKEFIDTLIDQYDHLGEPLPEREPPAEGGGLGGLSLIDTLNFDDWLTVKNIVARWEHGYREPCYELMQRLTHVAAIEVEEEDNPISASGVCIAFHDAIQNLGVSRVARRRLFEAFEATLVTRLASLYETLNAALVASGVLEVVERPVQVQREPDARASEEGREEVEDPRPDRSEPAGPQTESITPEAAATAPDSAPDWTPADSSPPPQIEMLDIPGDGADPSSPPAAPAGSGASPLEAYASTVSPAPTAEIKLDPPDLERGDRWGATQGLAEIGIGPPPPPSVPAPTPAASQPDAPPPPAAPRTPPGAPEMPAAAPAISPAGSSPYPAVPEQSSVPASAAFRTARSLLGLRRHGFPGTPAPGSACSTQDLIAALAAMPARPGDERTTKGASLDLSTQVHDAAAEHGYELETWQQDAVDVISNVLDCILGDNLINETVKGRIKRLSRFRCSRWQSTTSRSTRTPPTRPGTWSIS